MPHPVRVIPIACIWFCYLSIVNPSALSGAEQESTNPIDQAIKLLANLSDQPEAVTQILTHFDQLGEQWVALNSQISAAHERERDKLARTLPTALPTGSGSFQLNPWAGINQTPPDYPQFDSPTFLATKNLPEKTATFFLHSIPALFRLAEFLGIGRNELQSEEFFSEPHIFFGEFNSHQINCRVDQHIYGLFTIHESNTPIETFRRTLETQDFIKAIDIRISREVKPHHFSLREIKIDETYPGPHSIQWIRNKMAERFPSHSVSVGLPVMTREQQTTEIAKLSRLIEEHLLNLRQTIAKHIEHEATESPAFEQFQHHLEALQAHPNHSVQSAGCQWKDETMHALKLLRDQIDLIGNQATSSRRSLPNAVVIEILHALRHLAAPENTSQAAEIAWSTRFTLVTEKIHE